MPFAPFLPVNRGFAANENVTDTHSLISRLRLSSERKAVMQALELLIIDEISMVRCDVLDAIDAVLKHVRNQYNKPFGGVQVLVIGDMYQLPPVVKDDEWNLLSPHYASPYFFNSQVITQQPLVYIELNKIYRQTDKSFVSVLNQVRNNELDQDGYELLHSRYQQNFTPEKDDAYITLTTHNNIADDINFKNLNQLFGTTYLYEAEIEGEFYEKAYPADVALQLKIGAQVMFIKNDTEKIRRYYNGKIGVVEKIEEGKIFIQCKDEPGTIEIKKEKWKNIRYSLNKSNNQIEEDELGSFTQYPLRLAWAITIHKSQGLTFEKAIVDAGAAFAPGQVYVALSRCTTLEGIILKSRITPQSLHTDHRIAAFTETKKSEIIQQNLFEQAKKHYQQELIASMFYFDTIEDKSKILLNWIKEHTVTFGEAAMQSVEAWHQQIKQLQTITAKFFPVLENYFISNLLPEEDEALQKRLIAAIQYFFKELDYLKQSVLQLKTITDSKIVAKEYYDKASDLFFSLSYQLYLMEGCKEGFFADKFLERKRNIANHHLLILPIQVPAVILKTIL
ncbi:MAG: AAA family ATPase [Chitinophagaceae bacterium]|nr:AAA family ATPase [Chitinophagaceae bacterium]